MERVALLKIVKGSVYHSRRQGADNSFRYPLFFIYFRTDQEPVLSQLFRSRFYRLLSFRSQDYLHKNSGDLDENIKQFLRQNCNYEAEEVWLHTLPRMLGYAFNPVSFWLCHKQKKLEAILVEVNNTFGERHFYWIHPDEDITSEKWFRAEKVFHVSPFFPVDGHYKFRFQITEKNAQIDIHYYENEKSLRLITGVQGKFSSLSEQSPLKLFGRYGWMTLMVIFRIHTQAFRLFFKKSQFYSKPAPPEEKVSL